MFRWPRLHTLPVLLVSQPCACAALNVCSWAASSYPLPILHTARPHILLPTSREGFAGSITVRLRDKRQQTVIEGIIQFSSRWIQELFQRTHPKQIDLDKLEKLFGGHAKAANEFLVGKLQTDLEGGYFTPLNQVRRALVRLSMSPPCLTPLHSCSAHRTLCTIACSGFAHWELRRGESGGAPSLSYLKTHSLD